MSSITTAQRLYLFIDHRDRGTGLMKVSLYTQVCQVNGWDKEDRALRLEFFSKALGRKIRSSTEIGKLKDFDDLKGAALAIIHPSNLNMQMRQAEMPTTRLIYAIRQLAPEAYIIAEAGRKFHTGDWTTLDESDLTMLRNHITARAAGIRWPAQEAALSVNENPDWTV